MARVSKAVSCQSAVMRITPPNDPPVKRRRSEAGDWGKKCLQIGRQFGNSSGDDYVAHHLFGAIVAIPWIAEDRDGLCFWIDEPVLGNSVLSIEISLGHAVICTGRWRNDLDGKTRHTLHSGGRQYRAAIGKDDDQIRLDNRILIESDIQRGVVGTATTRLKHHVSEQGVQVPRDVLV